MTDAGERFLYLTTTGRQTGQPRRIEIWYVEYAGHHYMVAENRERAHWVQNIKAHPEIRFSVGTRADNNADLPERAGIGRIIDPDQAPKLADSVRKLMDTKYDWSDGLIVEITEL